MTRYIRPKYCPRMTSPDMPLKKAHKKCPFRRAERGRFVCACPSGIRYLYKHGIKGMSKIKQMVLCIA